MGEIKVYEVQYIDNQERYPPDTKIIFLRGTKGEINLYCAENRYRIVIVTEYKSPKVISLSNDPYIKIRRERIAKEKEIERIRTKMTLLEIELVELTKE